MPSISSMMCRCTLRESWPGDSVASSRSLACKSASPLPRFPDLGIIRQFRHAFARHLGRRLQGTRQRHGSHHQVELNTGSLGLCCGVIRDRTKYEQRPEASACRTVLCTGAASSPLKILARLAEVKGGYPRVNAEYGRLGRMLCVYTRKEPDVRQKGPNRGKERLWAVWSNGWRTDEGFVWQMLPSVAEALEELGWVTPETDRRPEVNAFNWQIEARRWLRGLREITPNLEDSIIFFFERAFQSTRCPDRAWFGAHSTGLSLVVGGIYLAAVHRTGKAKGLWLLVDQEPPAIEGVECTPVLSTLGSEYPLIWVHAKSLTSVLDVVINDHLWEMFGAASEKILLSSRIANDRDSVHERRKKRRLSEFWVNPPPEELAFKIPEEFEEGHIKFQLHRRKERNPEAVRQEGDCLGETGLVDLRSL